ncbi:MAG: (Fe-S)-binding protein [Thermoleophilia bacterium]|nr:(Fe-S)-binding protein [Thermoleophilia bacterium]
MNGRQLDEFKRQVDICLVCAACFAHGPVTPHNWTELPPPEWDAPNDRCPSYEYYGLRSHTGMGRQMLAASVFREGYPVDQDLIDVVSSCTNCGVCSEVCPMWRPLDAIAALRQEFVQRGLQPRATQKLDANVAECHNLFRGRTREPVLEALPRRGADLYFAGCEAAFRQGATGRATVEILRAAGIEVAHMGGDEWCCGFVADWGGNASLSEEVARHNVQAAVAAGTERLITSCAECYAVWKTHYPSVVGELPFEVVHVSEVLAGLLDEGALSFDHEIARTVTYHDPCFLGRHGGVYDEPRRVLAAIPGLKVREMRRYGRWSYCCGSGGKLTQLTYPDFADATGAARVHEAEAVAGAVVTACPACVMQLRRTAKKQRSALEVFDLPLMVAEAMGIEVGSRITPGEDSAGGSDE